MKEKNERKWCEGKEGEKYDGRKERRKRGRKKVEQKGSMGEKDVGIKRERKS